MDQFQTPYFKIQDDEAIQLAIVGKDPFPKRPTEIPFCKPSWDDQLVKNCSGRHVLRSLGIDIENARARYGVPQDLFEALRKVGIVFLNASYKYIGVSTLQRKHLHQLRMAHKVNLPFLTKAKTIILCGQAKRIRWLPGMEEMGIAVVHPDERNRISRCQQIREQWEDYWSPMAIAERFHMDLTAACAVAVTH